MSKISNGFREGYVVNKVKHSIDNFDKPVDFDKLEYPNGIIPFIFLLILYVVGELVVMIVGWQLDPFFYLTWNRYLISVPGVTLCMNLLWLLSRTGIFNSFGYMSLKFSRILKIDKLKTKINITAINASKEEIKNYEEFTKYVKSRKEHTKKYMYISVSLHLTLFIISTIILLVVGKV